MTEETEEESSSTEDETTPERARARRTASAGLASRAQLALLVAALLPVTLIAITRLSSAEAVVEVAPPERPDTAAARAELAALDKAQTALAEANLKAASAELGSELQLASDALMTHLRVARDARKKTKGKGRKKASAPFSLDELEPALAKLGVTPEGTRVLFRRDGTVLAPAAPKPLPVPLVVEGGDAALASVVEGSSVAARRCVVREGLCLADIRAVRATPLGTSALTASLDWTPPALAPTPLTTPWWPLAAAAGLALFLALLFGARARAQLQAPLDEVEQRLRSLAAGHPSQGSAARAPAELARIHDRVDELTASLGALSAHQASVRERDAALLALADQLGRVAEGDLTQSFDELLRSDDVPLRTLVETLARATRDLERQLVRIRSHLDVAEAPETPAGLRKRVEAMAPISGIVREMGGRMLALARLEGTPERVQQELLRLAKAAKQRSVAAEGLYQALSKELDAGGADALDQIAEDLGRLQLDLSTPTLIAALQGLDEGQITARVQARVGQAPTST